MVISFESISKPRMADLTKCREWINCENNSIVLTLLFLVVQHMWQWLGSGNDSESHFPIARSKRDRDEKRGATRWPRTSVRRSSGRSRLYMGSRCVRRFSTMTDCCSVVKRSLKDVPALPATILARWRAMVSVVVVAILGRLKVPLREGKTLGWLDDELDIKSNRCQNHRSLQSARSRKTYRNHFSIRPLSFVLRIRHTSVLTFENGIMFIQWFCRRRT